MSYTVGLLRTQGIEPAMVLLLDRIQKRATATYGELARRLPKELGLIGSKIFPTHVGAVAGTLMDRIQEHYPSAPLINLLIVNQSSGLPSSGCFSYLDALWNAPSGTAKRMPDEQRNREIRKLWQEVYAFADWEKVYHALFGRAPKSACAVGLEEFKEYDGKAGDWGGCAGGESIHHKRLKQYVLKHPQQIGVPESQLIARCTEQELLSGDSVDVFFASNTVSYVVEVKSFISSDDDLKRGLYQCLKYRVVLSAQQECASDDDSVLAKLVVEREPPPDLVELARRLKVRIHVVPLKR